MKIAPQVSEFCVAAVIVTTFPDTLHAPTIGSFPCTAGMQMTSFGKGGVSLNEQDVLAFIKHSPPKFPVPF